MSHYWVSTSICLALAGLFLVAVHAIVYRYVFVHRTIRLCSDRVFHSIVLNEPRAANWPALRNHWLNHHSGLGWLNECIRQMTPSEAVAKADAISREHASYLQALLLVCNLSTLFGLLGTVSAFLVSKNVNEVGLNTAFVTTAIGIVISIPPAIYLSVTHSGRLRFERQYFGFTEFMNQRMVNAATTTVTHSNANKSKEILPSSTSVACSTPPSNADRYPGPAARTVKQSNPPMRRNNPIPKPSPNSDVTSKHNSREVAHEPPNHRNADLLLEHIAASALDTLDTLVAEVSPHDRVSELADLEIQTGDLA